MKKGKNERMGRRKSEESGKAYLRADIIFQEKRSLVEVVVVADVKGDGGGRGGKG